MRPHMCEIIFSKSENIGKTFTSSLNKSLNGICFNLYSTYPLKWSSRKANEDTFTLRILHQEVKVRSKFVYVNIQTEQMYSVSGFTPQVKTQKPNRQISHIQLKTRTLSFMENSRVHNAAA